MGAVVPIETSPDDAPRRQMIGGTGTLISGGLITSLDPNTELRGSRWYGTPTSRGVAQQMLQDPVVRLSLASIANPVASAKWDVKPASQSDLDREVADFVRWSLFECLPWPVIARRMVLAYASIGVALEEVADDVRPVPRERFPLHAGDGSGIVPVAFESRPARTVHRWIPSVDLPSRLAAIEQNLVGGDADEPGRPLIPADRLFRVTWEQDGADYLGTPILRSAYGPWKVKTVLRVVEAIQHERHHIGVPKIGLPEGATDEDRDVAIEIAANLRANERAYLVLPHGYSAEILTTNGTTDIRRTIEAQDMEILRNTFSGFLALENHGASGSFALASSLEGQHQTSLETHPELICASLNHGVDGWSIVERIVRLNYGADVPLPRVIARLRRSSSEVIDQIVSLTSADVIRRDADLEAFARDLIQAPPRSEVAPPEDLPQ